MLKLLEAQHLAEIQNLNSKNGETVFILKIFYNNFDNNRTMVVRLGLYFVVVSIAAATAPPGKTIARTLSRPEGNFELQSRMFVSENLDSRGAGRRVAPH